MSILLLTVLANGVADLDSGHVATLMIIHNSWYEHRDQLPVLRKRLAQAERRFGRDSEEAKLRRRIVAQSERALWMGPLTNARIIVESCRLQNFGYFVKLGRADPSKPAPPGGIICVIALHLWAANLTRTEMKQIDEANYEVWLRTEIATNWRQQINDAKTLQADFDAVAHGMIPGADRDCLRAHLDRLVLVCQITRDHWSGKQREPGYLPRSRR
jgi:hypothetical protein